jgi:hypothetical protein
VYKRKFDTTNEDRQNAEGWLDFFQRKRCGDAS